MKKKISIAEVEHIAKLARIGLNEEEKEKFSDELSTVLSYIEQLKEINASKIEPVAQVTGVVNVTRDDNIENCDEKTKQKIAANFPEEKNGYIKVKQVLS